MSDILKMASIDSPMAVWVTFFFIAIFMFMLFYVGFMRKDRVEQLANQPLDEDDLLMDHEYDGIRELDNALPPWWKNLFYISIVFAVVYMLGYHAFEMWNLPEAEYVAELKEAGVYEDPDLAATSDNTIVEDAPKLSPEEALAASIKAGRKIYARNCSACHAGDGGGGVGPNLCDEFWIHGGQKEDVIRIVTEGVPAKGMIPWKSMLSEQDIIAVSDFVLSLQGTTPTQPKEPQGEKVAP